MAWLPTGSLLHLAVRPDANEHSIIAALEKHGISLTLDRVDLRGLSAKYGRTAVISLPNDEVAKLLKKATAGDATFVEIGTLQPAAVRKNSDTAWPPAGVTHGVRA
ncbi:MAG TPA: hypothetical protein VJN92_15590 [Candidatus Acidoferrum sp.]|nr:hypothetical protein [Candidatus Acidoferrum sp.]